MQYPPKEYFDQGWMSERNGGPSHVDFNGAGIDDLVLANLGDPPTNATEWTLVLGARDRQYAPQPSGRSARPRCGSARSSFAPGLVLGATFERRLAGRISLRAEASSALWLLQLDRTSGISPRLSPRFSLGLAVDLP